MEVYTNAKVVKELIKNKTKIEVHPFDRHVPKSEEVDVFLFDGHLLQFIYSLAEVCLHEPTVLWRRPDWSGTIFETMKNNKHFFLFDRVWY